MKDAVFSQVDLPMESESETQFCQQKVFMPIIRNKFDFEIGYLIKSPCSECEMQKNFPGCIDDCTVLDKIQTILARGISCTRNFSSLESYALLNQGWKEK